MVGLERGRMEDVAAAASCGADAACRWLGSMAAAFAVAGAARGGLFDVRVAGWLAFWSGLEAAVHPQVLCRI